MAPDKRILGMCQTAIKQRFGTLKDLPNELANTVANIFYQSFEFSLKWTEVKLENPFHPSSRANETGTDGVGGSVRHDDVITSFYIKTKQNQEALNKMRNNLIKVQKITKIIEILRTIDKKKELDRYERQVDLILDVMKYNIEDAKNKSLIIREIERKLKQESVDEIPDLHLLL